MLVRKARARLHWSPGASSSRIDQRAILGQNPLALQVDLFAISRPGRQTASIEIDRWRPRSTGGVGEVTDPGPGAKQPPPHWLDLRMRLHITRNSTRGVNYQRAREGCVDTSQQNGKMLSLR